jgi:hypothetical protein
MKSAHSRWFATVGFLGMVLVGALGPGSTPAGAASGSVPANVVEAQAAKALAAETGQKPPKVTCHGDLVAKVGAHIDCTLVPRGSKLVYPVRVTVNSVTNGTAHFVVQVGQAKGAANLTKFCSDNATLEQATSTATTSAELLAVLTADGSTILNLQSTAPSKIVVSAGTIDHAARVALNSGNARDFETKAVLAAREAVDELCEQNLDGAPANTPTITG